MASLQARHKRDCAIVTTRAASKARAGASGGANQWTTLNDATKQRGCTCAPTYFVTLRHDGKLIRERVGENRREAERALDARRGDVARREYRVLQDIRFDKWADTWLAAFSGKQNSKIVYSQTLAYAKRTFGARKVRDLTAGDVRRLLTAIQEANAERRKPKDESDTPVPVSPATLAKHLRQLGACLQAAVDEGYATENPVRGLPRSVRPKVAKARPVFYTDVELARLWPELAYRPVMLALFKTAVGTGMRLGELVALRWDDVDLLAREIHVGRTFVPGIGETPTKSGEPRTVDLTPPAAKVLEDWFSESHGDRPGREGKAPLVFEREEGGEIDGKYLTRRLLPAALTRAGIPRVGEGGRSRDFHSLRHTFARKALEAGAPIDWVRRQLGHSSVTLTVDIYGHWSRAAEKSQAEKLADAFAL